MLGPTWTLVTLLALGPLPDAERRAELYAATGVMDVEVAWLDEAEGRWRAAGARDDDPLGVALANIFAAYAAIEAGDPAYAGAKLDAAEAALGDDEPALAALVASTQSVALSGAGELEAAVEAARRAVSLGEAIGAAEFVAVNHLNAAVALAEAGDVEPMVIECGGAVVDPAAAWLDNPYGVMCLNHVAAARFTDGDPAAARTLWEVSIAYVERDYGADSHEFAVLSGNLGRAALVAGDAEEAVARFERALAISEEAGRQAEAWTYAGFLAEGLVALGGLERAEALHRRLLEEHEHQLGVDSVWVAADLGQLATVLQKQGRYAEAAEVLDRAVGIGEVHLDENPLHLASSLVLYAGLKTEEGAYADAQPLFERALELQVAALGEDHVDVAATLTNYGNLYRDAGIPADAVLNYERALAIYEASLPPNHVYIATALTNLAGLYQELGDRAAALPKLERALAIYEASVGPEHEWTATGLNNVGRALEGMEDLPGAVAYVSRAVRIWTTTLGPDHPNTLGGRAVLATLHLKQERYDVAEAEFAAVLQAQEARLGSGHPRLAGLRTRYGKALWAMDRPDEALEQVSEAIDVFRAWFGANNPQMAEVWTLYAEMMRHAEAVEEVRYAARMAHEANVLGVQALMVSSSERQRLAYALEVREARDLVISAYDRPGDEVLAYTHVLVWKSLVLRSLATQREALLAQQEPALGEEIARLQEVRRQLSTATFEPPDPDNADAVRRRVAALTEQKEALERSLARRSLDFEWELHRFAVDPVRACRALSRREAVVDFLRFEYTPYFDGADEVLAGGHYVAFVLLGGRCRSPVRVDLGPADAIDLAVTRYRRRVADPRASASVAGRAGEELRALLWDPVERVLGGRDRVWVVPDGTLSAVPFGALPRAGGRFLVEDFEFSSLDSGMDVVQRRRRSDATGSLVVGGIAYDELQARALDGDDGPASSPTLASRGLRGLDDFAYLPATAVEAEEVAASLRGRGDVLRLGGVHATEAAIRERAPGRALVHLATHGFFATGADRSVLAGGEFNPMLLSGIVLAGANDRGAMFDGTDDGVLTAEEVVSLDLRGTRLVTLSACETGLGEVADGEGVLGLRRAFTLAGAEALVLSLWKVPDAETRELMTSLYAEVAASKKGRLDAPAALREAQLQLIARLRADTGEAPPFFWGAFVVSGR